MSKAVILIGGPLKGTRFRPLSFDVPKPLFPVAGVPTIQHLIEACCCVPNLNDILLIGFYKTDNSIEQFIASMKNQYNINIRYVQEHSSLGTAGGIYHFQNEICSGNPESFFLINGDVCGDFSLKKMVDFHKSLDSKPMITVMATEATRQQSLNYGCIVEHKETHEILHYVEKPSTFVSTSINSGIYLISLEIFSYLEKARSKHINEFYTNDNSNHKDCIRLEQDILTPLAGMGKLFVYHTNRWWSQIKTAGSAIYANRHYLELYHRTHPERLTTSKGEKCNLPNIIGDVFIHPTAQVHETATLGPNVSIGQGVTIGAGVRIRESIILGNATIQDHSLVLHSIIGWNSTVGSWARVEGTPSEPNPNKPFAKMENMPLFNADGRLNPSITVLGCNVQVPSEIIVLNSIVLPHKDLGQSYKNEIIL